MNTLFINGFVYYHTEKKSGDEAFTELCDVLREHGIMLDIVVEYEMELRDKEGYPIE